MSKKIEIREELFVIGEWKNEKMHRECNSLCQGTDHFERVVGFWTIEEAVEELLHPGTSTVEEWKIAIL